MGNLQQFSDQAFIPLVCMCLPGIAFILGGLRIIRLKKVVAPRRMGYRWGKPQVLYGDEAIKNGKEYIIFGGFFLIIGILALIGLFTSFFG
jgi:hypothetical protein